MPIYQIDGLTPVVPEESFVHPTAVLIGDVILGKGVYVGPNASLRGDFGRIVVKDSANIQDNCVMHGFPEQDTVVEEDGHIGHSANFPFSSVLSFIAMAMVIVFFVTSADSGAMVVDTLASGGVANTPVWQRIFWASLMGIVAIALLLAGGLSALQTVTIASALPFSVILLISIYGLLKALRRDLTKRESLSMATIAPTAARNPIPWQRRLRNIAYLPKRSLVKRFMDDVIQPAMTLVQEELNKQGTISHISDAVDDRIRLEVDLGNELNFIYEVRLRGYISPTFALAAMDNDEQQTEQHRYYRAEVYLKEGGQNYDVMGWNQEQLINDILDQYEKHLHFLHLVR